MVDATLFGRTSTFSSRITHASLSNDGWAATTASSTSPSSSVRLVSIEEVDYPARLRSIEFPPRHLYIVGDLVDTPHSPIAIVGSRTPSGAGATAAFDVAATLAERGHSIISGLASGIDSAAHRGALSVGGHTVAVVGTGADRVYPPQNRDLRDQIAQHGAIVSQFSLGQGPSKTTFPARNALIAGLSVASLLIEASERSGTRIEAELTLEQGKPVLLWAPLLADESWTKDYASHPLVRFVDDVDEIAELLAACSVR